MQITSKAAMKILAFMDHRSVQPLLLYSRGIAFMHLAATIIVLAATVSVEGLMEEWVGALDARRK